ncbi:MAG: DMT family transporter [Actinobacteria bacterium]|nr:DMT family transporter [Actinomycetota bacterium]
MAVALGVLVAIAFGSGDFLGGRATMSATTPGVLVVSQCCAVAGAVVVALAVGAHVATADLVYGVFAGVVNVIGLALLYRGLATGAMSVVAPITAVVASLIPVAWGFANGERPSLLVLVGVVLETGASALVAAGPEHTPRETVVEGAVTAVLAGCALGTSLVLYAQTSPASGFWPVLTARMTAAALVVAFVWWLRRSREVPLPSGRARLLAVGAGVLDVTAASVLLLALRNGLIVVVAPVAALGPGFTVLLAWILLGERLSVPQRVGLAIALCGLVLVSGG